MIQVTPIEKKILVRKRMKNNKKWSKKRAKENIEEDYEVEEKPDSKKVNTETI